MNPGLGARRCWFFDMDGTLTAPVHDYVAMRAELGVPEDGPGTIEGVMLLPEPERSAKRRLLDEIGARYVADSRPHEGARELLERLRAAGCALGLVTRNSRPNTLATLDVLGMREFFPDAVIATRDDSEPKPSPEALLRMLDAWGGDPAEAVMVGDAVYDVHAGRNAGAATVLLDPDGDSPHRAEADLVVEVPADLLPLLG